MAQSILSIHGSVGWLRVLVIKDHGHKDKRRGEELLARGLATLIHIPLGCIVQGAIPGQLPPAVCQQWVACWPERAPLRGPLGLLKRVLLIEVAGT